MATVVCVISYLIGPTSGTARHGYCAVSIIISVQLAAMHKSGHMRGYTYVETCCRERELVTELQEE